MGFLAELDKSLRSNPNRNLHICHRDTKKIGLSASHMFDEVVLAAVLSWKRRRLPFVVGGTISNTKAVNNFLLAFGWFKLIGLSATSLANVDQDYAHRFVSFTRRGSSLDLDDKGRAACELVTYFNTCLNYTGRSLTDIGMARLIDAISELICNAEQHAGVYPANWVALGCFNKELNECRFSILNEGQTISQSLWSDTSEARSALISIIETDSPSLLDRFWNWLKTGRHESYFNDATWTVFALQEGVSSKRTQEGLSATRGKGFMDVLSFISEVSDDTSGRLVSILSGSAQVRIDYDYPIMWVDLPKGPSVRKIVFNTEGDLLKPQDCEKVKVLSVSHQGTIISGEFRLKSESALQA